jgi:hypothetical protein
VYKLVDTASFQVRSTHFLQAAISIGLGIENRIPNLPNVKQFVSKFEFCVFFFVPQNENRVLRRIFGPKREEDGSWRKLHNDELHSLYSSPDIVRMIKSRRMRFQRSMLPPSSLGSLHPTTTPHGVTTQQDLDLKHQHRDSLTTRIKSCRLLSRNFLQTEAPSGSSGRQPSNFKKQRNVAIQLRFTSF